MHDVPTAQTASSHSFSHVCCVHRVKASQQPIEEQITSGLTTDASRYEERLLRMQQQKTASSSSPATSSSSEMSQQIDSQQLKQARRRQCETSPQSTSSGSVLPAVPSPMQLYSRPVAPQLPHHQFLRQYCTELQAGNTFSSMSPRSTSSSGSVLPAVPSPLMAPRLPAVCCMHHQSISPH